MKEIFLAMRKLFLLIVFFLPSVLFGSSIAWPGLTASDYYRGTAGERLFFHSDENSTDNLYLCNDLRYCRIENYFKKNGKKREVRPFNRYVNILSFNLLPLKNIVLSCRIPYVYVEEKFSYKVKIRDSGISDVFLGLSYRLFNQGDKKVFLSTGMRFPSGLHETNAYDLPLGTGNIDIPLIINTNSTIKDINAFFDIGFIFLGNRELPPSFTHKV